MPWKHNGKTITIGKAWVADDGTQHPAVWMRWSDSEKKANGLTWENPSATEEPYDSTFYFGRNTDGSLIERKLDDEKVMDRTWDEIKNEWVVTGPLKDKKGNQVIEEGLKTIWVNKTKEMANNLLSSSDWMITRKAEKGTAIPSEIQTYRDDVRTACNTIETKINNISSLADFIKLFKVPSDGSNAPIYDFPDEI